MRAQLSLDLLFAVTLIMLTVVSLINLSNQEIMGAKTFDKQTRLKVFAIDLRDTVTKAYSAGPGFSVRKDFPIPLAGSDVVTVTLNATSNMLKVDALISGRRYVTYESIPVPVKRTTTVQIIPGRTSLWVVVGLDSSGERYVEIREAP
ncbi:hypothetical protein FH039_02285 [Thermococcus indicus]|uniref:Uncharacterized protein n=1 Tax=Thermococcus indicus TaxID=2586643 RepID=A0A4Y5SIN0_9EURY|nr:hypothetical protein [Thermococcus indicus]QDA30676.1 hypothetical protein FH039_02285 [Thermococcus indicus]